VLHIEDNPANVQLVAQILQRRGGVRLQAASSGADGLAAATAARPDLVLLDLHLPDISGEEVLAQLHRQPATAAVPVVVVTADATPAQRRHLLQHGAAAYVTKPIDVRELLALVDQVLGTRVR
jgi:CheY-like chemotaxis protein